MMIRSIKKNRMMEVSLIRWTGLLLLMFPVCAIGQISSKDSIAILKELVKVSSVYKKLPLYMEMSYSGSSNLILRPEDTMHVSSVLCATEKQTFLRFGELEQFTNDSTAITVSDSLKRITIHKQPSALRERMKQSVGTTFTDSSANALLKSFAVTRDPVSNGLQTIRLTQRQQLNKTSLPKSVIIFQYNPVTMEPVKFSRMERKLLPVPDDDSAAFKEAYGNTDNLLKIADGSYVFVREKSSVLEYMKIIRGKAVPDLQQVSDRVTKNSAGEYEKAKGYDEYIIEEGN